MVASAHDLGCAHRGVRVVGAWADVKRKGRRILADGDYIIERIDGSTVVAEVMGDHDFYDVYITAPVRVDTYEKNPQGVWSCTCPWGDWSYNRVVYRGRMCSHAYAMYLLLQRERERRRKRKRRSSSMIEDGLLAEVRRIAGACRGHSVEAALAGAAGDALAGLAVDTGVDMGQVIGMFEEAHAASRRAASRQRGGGFRKRDLHRTATRVFTAEEREALLEEDGVSRHWLSGMFD